MRGRSTREVIFSQDAKMIHVRKNLEVLCPSPCSAEMRSQRRGYFAAKAGGRVSFFLQFGRWAYLFVLFAVWAGRGGGALFCVCYLSGGLCICCCCWGGRRVFSLLSGRAREVACYRALFGRELFFSLVGGGVLFGFDC